MKTIEKYFKELIEQHPYKQCGNRDSYSEYNEGWQDALDLASQIAKQIQIDAIEETVKLYIENVKLIDEPIGSVFSQVQLILQITEQLKKEIE